MAFDDELRGVGGWLVFFLITLGIIGPLWIVADILISIRDPEASLAYSIFPALLPIQIGLSVGIVLLRWFAVYRFLAVHNWTTVQIGIATIWILAAINVLGMPLLVASVMGVPLGLLMQAMGPGFFIGSLGYAGIWTAYLLKSERVRNTYGQVDHGEAAEIFS